LVGKPERKRPLRRPRRRWEDNIRMDLREIVWEFVDWIHLGSGHGPMAGCCEHSNEPASSIKGRVLLD